MDIYNLNFLKQYPSVLKASSSMIPSWFFKVYGFGWDFYPLYINCQSANWSVNISNGFYAFNRPCLSLIPNLTVVLRIYPKSLVASQFMSLVAKNYNNFKHPVGMLSIALHTSVINSGHYFKSNPLILILRFLKFGIYFEHYLKYDTKRLTISRG